MNTRWLAYSCVLVLATACGGGGGDDDDDDDFDANVPDAEPGDFDAPELDAFMPDAAPPACSCAVTAVGPTRGSAIAISPDDATLVSCNRDTGTVTITRVDYTTQDPAMTVLDELNLGPGSEPWQVAIDACGECAYVVERQSQQVTRIEGLDTNNPTVGPTVAVGSEPTGLALTPNGTQLYVANWVDGTVSVIDPVAMSVSSTIDLNATLAATGLLGTVTARPALAHPRSIAITNDGDADDTNESVLVTEFYAQRTAPESIATADTGFKGLLYRIATGTGAATTLDLPPVVNTMFNDHNNAMTGCYPNQVGSVTVLGTTAWVTSTCASPKGPLGVFTATGTCTIDSQCGALGGSCNLGTLTCNPNNTDVKTTTHPAVTTVNLTNGVASTTNLDRLFEGVASSRMPLLPSDLGFRNTFAYVTAMGADASFRLTTDGNTIQAVGSANNDFIDLRTSVADTLIRMPVGIAVANGPAFAFVANEGSRDITALELNVQAIAGDQASDFRIVQAAALPAAGTADERALKGKRFFTTGLGRWSLSGQAWGSCAACHPDGLSDNVTWYFARGPRQSTSLDGSFASTDPNDQRVFNWTAIFDEVADFEGNVRGVSGGLGAIVDAGGLRINTANQTPPQQGLQGSSTDAADPSGVSPHPHSVIADWGDIEVYIERIRSPRRPTNLTQSEVDAGEALFLAGQGNCVGCHSGAKWTISKMFYTPNDIPNAATASAAATSLGNVNWNVALNGFPVALTPATTPGNQRMRFGAAPAAEQLQCSLRPVGTFGTSDAAVGVLELRQDMATAAQGNATDGRGYNPPSLLGLQVGGPFFHAGNARTLEEVFDDRFLAHHQSAVAAVFAPNAAQKAQLVQYLLSIDEAEPTFAIPAKGATGGDLCFYP